MDEHVRVSEPPVLPVPRGAGRVHARAVLLDRRRGRVLRLQIVDYYYLVVGHERFRRKPIQYRVDLRFVDPALQRSRHLATGWLWLATALLASAAMVAAGSLLARDLEAVAACGVLALLSLLSGLVCAYRTSEGLTVTSLYGRARLLSFASAAGKLEQIQPFIETLEAHMRMSAEVRPPTKAAHLREEMREHFRLRESGALSAKAYAASKSRILAEH